jgi:hypothetical protein
MSTPVRYEIRTASGSQRYYTRAVSVGNSNVLMTSETYWNKADAETVAKLMINGNPGATIVDLT